MRHDIFIMTQKVYTDVLHKDLKNCCSKVFYVIYFLNAGGFVLRKSVAEAQIYAEYYLLNA